jgi:hypothetical protein
VKQLEMTKEGLKTAANRVLAHHIVVAAESDINTAEGEIREYFDSLWPDLVELELKISREKQMEELYKIVGDRYDGKKVILPVLKGRRMQPKSMHIGEKN